MWTTENINGLEFFMYFYEIQAILEIMTFGLKFPSEEGIINYQLLELGFTEFFNYSFGGRKFQTFARVRVSFFIGRMAY